jgi:glycerophosphoryl diester phosphodiesterase
MMTYDEMIEVIQGYKDGKIIEKTINEEREDYWTEIVSDHHTFDFTFYTYRVKKEKTVNVYSVIRKEMLEIIYFDDPVLALEYMHSKEDFMLVTIFPCTESYAKRIVENQAL